MELGFCTYTSISHWLAASRQQHSQALPLLVRQLCVQEQSSDGNNGAFISKEYSGWGQEHRAGEKDWGQGIWEAKTVLHKRL